jgi:hypothetical protein
MVAVGNPFDMLGGDLRDFECTQSDVATELENEIITMTGGGASKPIEFGVGEPDVVFVWFRGGFESHIHC